MSDKYTPNYPNPEVESEVPNLSGLSPRQNVTIEEAAQRSVAESEQWMLARKVNGRYLDTNDSRAGLESLGFTVEESNDDLFYSVTAPEGWTKTTSGFWTTVLDADGNERISMFFKGAWYDRDSFLNFREA